MDDISNQINKYNQECEITRKYLSSITGIELSSMDISLALVEHFNLKDTPELLSKGLDNLKMITILKDYNFRKNKPELLETVELEVGVLPKDLPIILNEETIKNKNEIWRIHKNDADPFPHPIHAHNYSANVKLDLRDGKLYDKRDQVGTIRKKELVQIRDKVRLTDLPDMTI